MNGLPKSSRLRLKSDFDLLISGGRTIREHPVKAVYIRIAASGLTGNGPHQTPAGTQVAFVVPKKLFRKATDRNRIKRLMREAWRLHVHELNQSMLRQGKCLKTLLIFTGKELPDYATISSKIILILQRLHRENEVAADQDSAGPDSLL